MFRSVLILCLTATIMMDGHQVNGAAIPIWELLTHEEKMGRLFYVFVHLVQQYCKTSDIPDCPKVLTLYGMSNLVSEDERSLDAMDPYQRDAKTIVWEKIMRGEFKLPPKILNPTGTVMSSKPSSIKAVHQQNQKAVIDNDVYSSPYEVRVRPPADFVPPQASSATIIRFGRSVTQPDEELLPVLSEEDAHQLIGSLH